jgi:hypothetical protein
MNLMQRLCLGQHSRTNTPQGFKVWSNEVDPTDHCAVGCFFTLGLAADLRLIAIV